MGAPARIRIRWLAHPAMTDPADLADLPGLGPKSRAMLARAGIVSLGQLRDLGAPAAYLKARQANRGVSLNLLWGLESALTGMPWQEVARVRRTSLLLALDALQDPSRAPAGDPR